MLTVKVSMIWISKGWWGWDGADSDGGEGAIRSWHALPVAVLPCTTPRYDVRRHEHMCSWCGDGAVS